MLTSGMVGNALVKAGCIAVGRHPARAAQRGVSSGHSDALNT